MTTIILVILGVLLAAAAVLFVVYYGGDAFGNGHIEAEAGRLVGEGAQMEAALELYYRQEGHYPRGDDPVAELISAGYLDMNPMGTRTTDPDKWSINYDAGMILARLGTTDHEETTNICLKARQQLDLPKANTSTGIYRCDGTDSPGGRLSGREPCCIGEVAVGGGPKDKSPEAIYATACAGLGAMPLSSDADKLAYTRQAVQCLRGRAITTPTYLVSKANMDASGINFAAVANDYYVDTANSGAVDVRLWLKGNLYNSICAGLPTSADLNTRSWCSNGYYRERVTSEYMPKQKAILDAGLDRIEGFVRSSGISTGTAYQAAGGPQPDFQGRATSWSFVDYNNGEYYARANMSGQALCQWYRTVNGRTADLQRDRQYGQNECHYSGNTFYERRLTDTVRSGRYNRIKSELAKVRTSQAGLDNAYTTANYNAAGGYQPDLGDAATGWRLREYNRRFYVEAIVNDGQCVWQRNQWGQTTDLDHYQVAPEWCGWDRGSGATRVYMFDMTDDVRTKQFNIMRSEIEKLRQNPSYTPNFKGAASGWQYYNRDGNQYIEAFIDDNRCVWFREKIGASTNMDTFNSTVPEWCGWDGSGARRGFFVKINPSGPGGPMGTPQ